MQYLGVQDTIQYFNPQFEMNTVRSLLIIKLVSIAIKKTML